MPILLDIAFAHLVSRRRQSIVSLMGVALGVAFFVAVSSLMRGSEADFIQRLVNSSPHITIKDEFREPPRQPAEWLYSDGAVALRGLKPRDEVRGIRNHKRIVEALSRDAGAAVAPALFGQAILRYGSRDVAASIVGIEPNLERRITEIEDDIIAGSLDALVTSSTGIVVGRSLAAKFNAGLGDTLGVISPTGVVRMKIVGMFSTGVAEIDNSLVYMLLKRAQVLLDRPNVVNRIRVRLDDPYAADALAKDVEKRFSYWAESWQEANQDILNLLVVRNAILYSVVAAILLVASFGIFNIISTVILEKTRDIAILKSIGFREGDIRRIFLLEGLAVGTAGSLVGWAIGYAMLLGLGLIRFTVPGLTEESGFPLHYGIDQYLAASLFAVLSAMLAAYLPSRRAARLRPVDILRGAA